jgi:hypothetical protein
MNKKDKIVSSKWSAKCKLSFKFCNLKNNINFLTHLANAKLILIQLQLFKIIWFLNQIIIIFSQWRFNFLEILSNLYVMNNSNVDHQVNFSPWWWFGLNYPLTTYNVSKLSTHQQNLTHIQFQDLSPQNS